MRFMTKKLPAAAAASLLAAVAAAGQDTINALASYEQAQGFELMFDGANAATFRDRFVHYQRNNTTNTNLHSGWTVSAAQTDPDRPNATFGAIVNGSANVDIRSKVQYRDFDWRFEYRNSGNQGIFYRFDVSGQYPWETGVEFAVDNNVTQTTLKFRAGAAYDLFAPSEQAYLVRSTNRWNSVRIVAKGDSVEHWLNGVKVVAFRYWSPEFLAAYQNSKWTGYNRFCQTAPNNRTYIPQGYIGLQGDHGGAWQIRRMRILHDSLPGMNRVKLGPVDTTGAVPVLPAQAREAASYSLRTAPGLLRVTSAAPISSIEVRGLDGALARSARVPDGRTDFDLDVAGLRHGVYVVRVDSPSGTHHARALIH